MQNCRAYVRDNKRPESVWNLQLIVNSDSHDIGQWQASTAPLFDVSGILTFEAARSIPGLVEGSLVSVKFFYCRTYRDLRQQWVVCCAPLLGSVES